MTGKPRILIARAIPPEVVRKLEQHFEVESNQDDVVWNPQELAVHLKDKDGVLTTGSQTIDAALLAACPRLKVVANMAVGYNNFDVPAMTAAGVQGTNAPDVLTETTADFGFALLMATARRVTESEHYLRAGKWNSWRYDLFAGAEVHGSTLGIIGMGRIGQGIAKRGAHGFGMKVIYHNRSRLSPGLEAECKAGYVGKDELLATADHVVLVLPLHQGKPPHHSRGRDREDEAHGHADQHRARGHRG
jgi:gluconate 2-dehydrogenase